MKLLQNSDVKIYIILSFCVSLISLALFLTNASYGNIKALVNVVCMSLTPCFIDGNLFKIDTNKFKEDKSFKALRFLNTVMIVLVAFSLVIGALTAIGFFDVPSNGNAMFLCFGTNGDVLKFLNGYCENFLSQILNIKITYCYYILVYIYSILVKLISTYSYRRKMEKIKKAAEN